MLDIRDIQSQLFLLYIVLEAQSSDTSCGKRKILKSWNWDCQVEQK